MTDKRKPRPVPDGRAAKPSHTPRAGTRSAWKDSIDLIAKRVAKGSPIEPACRLYGVAYSAYRAAVEREDPDIEPILRARAELEVRMSEALADHGENARSHHAAAYLLERIAPLRWKQSAGVELTGAEAGPVAMRVELSLTDAIAGARGDDET